MPKMVAIKDPVVSTRVIEEEHLFKMWAEIKELKELYGPMDTDEWIGRILERPDSALFRFFNWNDAQVVGAARAKQLAFLFCSSPEDIQESFDMDEGPSRKAEA